MNTRSKYKILIVFTLLSFTFSSAGLFAQSLDCSTALQICDGIFPQPAVTAAIGNNDFANGGRGCLSSGENGSNWYWMEITSPGVLAFDVQGVQSDGISAADIDGAVWGPFTSLSAGCTAINTLGVAPARCSYAANTGFQLTAFTTQTSEGGGGDGRIAALTAAAGDYYIVFVDNFNANRATGAITIEVDFTTENTVLIDCPVPVSCGTCTNPVCAFDDKGTFAASGVQTPNPFTYNVCNEYSGTPFKAGDGSFQQCITVNSGSEGTIGLVQELSITGTDSNNDGQADCTQDIYDARTASLILASQTCPGTNIPPNRSDAGNGTNGFNPEWEGLQTNTNYILCVETTMPVALPIVNFACNYRESCTDIYHFVVPNTPPTINSNAQVTISENFTATVLDVDATDLEDANLNFSIINSNDASVFNINSSTGEITFKTAPDFENPIDHNNDNVYQVTVNVCDSEPLCVTQNITITITDIDEDNDGYINGTDPDDSDPCLPDAQSTACQVGCAAEAPSVGNN